MKTLLNRMAGRRAFGSDLPLTVTLMLLAALPVTAATSTPYTATGWITEVPVLGIWATNASGRVFLKGNVHVARVQADDPRVTGRLQAIMDVAYQADGTGVFYGTAYQEVGTWQNQTNFTPTGGLWELSYRGLAQPDNSDQMRMVGYGIGGPIDGLRLEITATRGPGPIFDPAIPYTAAGTVKPAPVNTTEIVRNFDGNDPYTATTWGNGSLVESNRQFNAIGDFPVPTTSVQDSYVFSGWESPTWSVPEGLTREWRVDLVSLDENATNTTIFVAGTLGRFYAFFKGRDFSFLLKWSGSPSIFACDRVATPNSNVVLALALTRVQPNLVITARVLDKANPNVVLYQRSVVDTPNVDPTLTVDEFQAVSGMRLVDLAPDPAGAPFTSFWAELGMFQYTDGAQPAPKAVFDNLEVRTYELPQIGIERGARLSWPAPAGVNYVVETAPTVLGPWRPIRELELPGVKQMSVPVNGTSEFFRLQQAP
jgi:hypothetical protein